MTKHEILHAARRLLANAKMVEDDAEANIEWVNTANLEQIKRDAEALIAQYGGRQ